MQASLTDALSQTELLGNADVLLVGDVLEEVVKELGTIDARLVACGVSVVFDDGL